jgi:hypothetical protein
VHETVGAAARKDCETPVALNDVERGSLAFVDEELEKKRTVGPTGKQMRLDSVMRTTAG